MKLIHTSQIIFDLSKLHKQMSFITKTIMAVTKAMTLDI